MRIVFEIFARRMCIACSYSFWVFDFLVKPMYDLLRYAEIPLCSLLITVCCDFTKDFLIGFVIRTLKEAKSTFHCITQFSLQKFASIIRFKLGLHLATAEIHSPEGTCPRFVSSFQAKTMNGGAARSLCLHEKLVMDLRPLPLSLLAPVLAVRSSWRSVCSG